jgi:hypothetical protein
MWGKWGEGLRWGQSGLKHALLSREDRRPRPICMATRRTRVTMLREGRLETDMSRSIMNEFLGFRWFSLFFSNAAGNVSRY